MSTCVFLVLDSCLILLSSFPFFCLPKPAFLVQPSPLSVDQIYLFVTFALTGPGTVDCLVENVVQMKGLSYNFFEFLVVLAFEILRYFLSLFLHKRLRHVTKLTAKSLPLPSFVLCFSRFPRFFLCNLSLFLVYIKQISTRVVTSVHIPVHNFRILIVGFCFRPSQISCQHLIMIDFQSFLHFTSCFQKCPFAAFTTFQWILGKTFVSAFLFL